MKPSKTTGKRVCQASHCGMVTWHNYARLGATAGQSSADRDLHDGAGQQVQAQAEFGVGAKQHDGAQQQDRKTKGGHGVKCDGKAE